VPRLPGTQDAEPDGGAERAEAEDDAHGKRGHALDLCDVFHSTLLREKASAKPVLQAVRHQ
jgi:hypothetical protein